MNTKMDIFLETVKNKYGNLIVGYGGDVEKSTITIVFQNSLGTIKKIVFNDINNLEEVKEKLSEADKFLLIGVEK